MYDDALVLIEKKDIKNVIRVQ